jgi:hypothetical protein
MYRVRIGKTPPRSTKKKMGAKCESTASPQNTGRSEAFKKLMRNCWQLLPMFLAQNIVNHKKHKLDVLSPGFGVP